VIIYILRKGYAVYLLYQPHRCIVHDHGILSQVAGLLFILPQSKLRLSPDSHHSLSNLKVKY